MKTTLLIEQLDLTEAQINSEARTVRQRLIVSGRSKNNRHYQEAVLQKAAPLFNGVKTYANHPSASESKDRPERSVRDVTGWLGEVTYENGALWGVRHFTRTQAGNDTWAIVEDIIGGKAPASLMGASINAVGKGKFEKDGDQNVLMVESIDIVHSVDDVTTPAAGGGFERLMAADSSDLTATLLSELSYEEWFECRPDFRVRLQNELKAVRQDSAIKAAQAEANRLATALQEAQATIKALENQREAAIADEAKVRRELAIDRALIRLSLPIAVKDDLRVRLSESQPERWEIIIDNEIRKSKAMGNAPKVAVTGADQRVDRSVKTDQVVLNWSSALTSPEALARTLAVIQKG